MKKLRLVAVSLFLSLGFSTLSHAQAPTKLPVELFFKNADITDVSVSPSGKYLAVNIRGKSGRMVLGIAETANIAKVNIIVRNDDIDVLSANWLTDDRLMFTISNTLDLDDTRNGRSYVINRDGSNQSKAIRYWIWGAMNDGSEDLMVAKPTWNNTDRTLRSVQLFRLDTKTDRTTPL